MDETTGEVKVGGDRERVLNVARDQVFGFSFEKTHILGGETVSSKLDYGDKGVVKKAVDSLLTTRIDYLKAEKEKAQRAMGDKVQHTPDGKPVKRPDVYEVGAKITDTERALETVRGVADHRDTLIKVVEEEAAIAYEIRRGEFNRQEGLAPRHLLVGPIKAENRASLANMRKLADSHIASVLDVIKNESREWVKP